MDSPKDRMPVLRIVYRMWHVVVLSSLTLACLAAPGSLPTALPTHSAQATLASTSTIVATRGFFPSPFPTATPLPTIPSVSPIPTVSLMAVGDVMLARQLGGRLAGGEVDYPFALVAETLRSADIAVANLECAIGERGEPLPKAYRFRAPPAAAASLAGAGIDLVSLANNHALDYGRDALADTLTLLDAAGVAHAGAGANAAAARAPAILERSGLSVAFLGYVDVPVERSGWDARSVVATDSSPGVAWASLDEIASDVAAAKTRADLVVVLVHSGYEYRDRPNPTQIAIAHTAVDAGAALVVGAHSHLLQGVEHYRGGLIAYSLGNFAFEIDRSRDSAILKVTLSRDGVLGLEWIPVVLDANDGRPRLAEGEARQSILRRVERLSEELK